MYFAASNTLAIVAVVSLAILGWLFCGFTAAAMARTNGENYNLWLIIGILTGPLGLFAAWAYFRYSGERHRRIRYGAGHQYDMPEIIRCPGCGQSVPSAFEACQFCHTHLHGRNR
jgi:hypothetical protein